MTAPVELVALECLRCRSRLPAEEGQVAWLCAACGQGQRLDEEASLQPVDVFFALSAEGEARWLPFWVFPVEVRVAERVSYGHQQPADARWDSPQTFVLPAFDTRPEDVGQWGTRFLRNPVQLQAGPTGSLPPVTVTPDEAQKLAEFVVLTIEAERRDKIKSIRAVLDFGPAQLWALPFHISGSGLRLALAQT
ncbi:MAG TPA: hypothetical protein VFI11_00535 [Anaerolineales bacterium]|nr:hypothetical protein [Anaerolineales bacterium]